LCRCRNDEVAGSRAVGNIYKPRRFLCNACIYFAAPGGGDNEEGPLKVSAPICAVSMPYLAAGRQSKEPGGYSRRDDRDRPAGRKQCADLAFGDRSPPDNYTGLIRQIKKGWIIAETMPRAPAPATVSGRSSEHLLQTYWPDISR